MRKLKNPWIDIEGFQCFACAGHNPHGLQMEFYEDGEDIVCFWEPKLHFQSWVGTLHGGIQSTLMDEIGGWVVHHSLKTSAVTSRMDTRFQKNIDLVEGQKLTIRGRLNRMMRNIAVIDVTITNKDGELCSKAEIFYFTFPQSVAIEKFHYKDFEYED
ncbi:MAG: PaaI family thioesterase [Paludibacteraceae bacterium]|nr:PaaI family thioesterase [Paludibacteraceae bacterium]